MSGAIQSITEVGDVVVPNAGIKKQVKPASAISIKVS